MAPKKASTVPAPLQKRKPKKKEPEQHTQVGNKRTRSFCFEFPYESNGPNDG